MKVALVIFVLMIHLLRVSAHSCQHKIPSQDDFVIGVPIPNAHIIRKRSLSQQMRIHIHYDQSLDELSEETRHYIRQNVVPQAVDYWQRALRVRSDTETVIRLLRECSTPEVMYKSDEAYSYCARECKAVTRCGEVRVPDEHLYACRTCTLDSGCDTVGSNGPGVKDSDFILYVSTKTTERCSVGTTVAYAAYCQLESSLDRPIAGYVNICPHSISTQIHDLKQTVATIKHEILHALGFSAGLFAFYRDEKGDPLTSRNPTTNLPDYNAELKIYQWSDRVVRTVTRSQWMVLKGYIRKQVHIMVTPRVVIEARNHFNCPSLEGAELEDQGVIGSAYTHWEKRVFENEAMTGTYTQNPVISRITLALMEDTGWYSANYNLAEMLNWGRHLGCDFVTKSCMEWMETKQQKSESIHPFCDKLSNGGRTTECTTDLKAVALCNLVEYKESLPGEFQYMTKVTGVDVKDLDRYAGSVQFADYCPYIQEFVWKENGTVVRNSACDSTIQPGHETQNYALEAYGSQSICLAHGSQWVLRQCDRYHEIGHWGSGCYGYRCEQNTGRLVITVSGREYRCTRRNQVLLVKLVSAKFLHEGSLVCPACEDVCGWQCKQTDPPQHSIDASVTVPCGTSSLRSGIAVFFLTLVLISSFY